MSRNPNPCWVLQIIHMYFLNFLHTVQLQCCSRKKISNLDEFGCAQIIYKLLPDKAWKMNHLS